MMTLTFLKPSFLNNPPCVKKKLLNAVALIGTERSLTSGVSMVN